MSAGKAACCCETSDCKTCAFLSENFIANDSCIRLNVSACRHVQGLTCVDRYFNAVALPSWTTTLFLLAVVCAAVLRVRGLQLLGDEMSYAPVKRHVFDSNGEVAVAI